uniref:Uncharacterized protein n=1 Tax=Macaca fascicularis TaxID=9541 RepID=A0A7N9IB75_MACFA
NQGHRCIFSFDFGDSCRNLNMPKLFYLISKNILISYWQKLVYLPVLFTKM